jgi:hypothetical protein
MKSASRAMRCLVPVEPIRRISPYGHGSLQGIRRPKERQTFVVEHYLVRSHNPGLNQNFEEQGARNSCRTGGSQITKIL